jgi:hypothetical protein
MTAKPFKIEARPAAKTFEKERDIGVQSEATHPRP